MRMHQVVISALFLAFGLTLAGCDGGDEQAQDKVQSVVDDLSREKIEQSLDAARRYFDAGKFTEARTILNKLVERVSDHVGANEMLAQVIFSEGSAARQSYRFDEAKTLFEDAADRYDRVVELEPNVAGWRQNAGNFSLMAGRTEQAIQHFAEAERLDPANPLHPLYRSLILLQQGQIEEAETAVSRALELDDSSAHAIATLASIRFEQGMTEEAFTLIQEARLNARTEDALSFRVMEARFARLSENPGRSLHLLSTLNEVDRANLGVAEETALACHALGEDDFAVQAWTHSYDLSPDWRAALGAAESSIDADKPLQAESWLAVARAMVGEPERVVELEARLEKLNSEE